MAGKRRYPGQVEAAVRRDLKALVSAHPMGEALEAMSLSLAQALDDGAGLAAAAVNRQLRENLLELARLAVQAEDDLDAELSAEIRNDAGAGADEPGDGDREGGGPAG